MVLLTDTWYSYLPATATQYNGNPERKGTLSPRRTRGNRERAALKSCEQSGIMKLWCVVGTTKARLGSGSTED